MLLSADVELLITTPSSIRVCACIAYRKIGFLEFLKAPDVEQRGIRVGELKNLSEQWKECETRAGLVELGEIAQRSQGISARFRSNMIDSISDAVRFLLDFSHTQPTLPHLPADKASWAKFFSDRIASLKPGDDKVRRCHDEFQALEHLFVDAANVIRDSQGKIRNEIKRQSDESHDLEIRFKDAQDERDPHRFRDLVGSIGGGDPELKKVKERLDQYSRDILKMKAQDQELSRASELATDTGRALGSTKDSIANVERTLNEIKMTSQMASNEVEDLKEVPSKQMVQADQSWRHLKEAFPGWT